MMPSVNSKDPYERSLAFFVATVRAAKKGRGKVKLTQKHIEVLESIEGFTWERNPDKILDRCEELKNWILSNDRYPKRNENDKIENSLAIFINTLRQANRGTARCKLTEEHRNILESIPGWVWDVDNSSLTRAKELREWCILNNKLPSYSSSDPQEKSLNIYIGTVRKVYRKKCKGVLTQEQKDILESIPNWKWEIRPPRNKNNVL